MNPEYPPNILGAAAMAYYLAELRTEAAAQGEGILLLDGGNFFQGSPLGMFDGGQTMVQFFNKMGLHAQVPGIDDFILGADNLSNLARQADYPLLACNLNFDNSDLDRELFKPYVMLDIAGVRVGVVGIVHAGFSDKVLAKDRSGITVVSEVVALQEWVPQVRAKGAELVIVLTSAGIPWDREDVYYAFRDSLQTDWKPESEHLTAIELGYFAEGVDIVVSGGISKGYPIPWYDPHSHTYVLQNYGGGTEFGHSILQLDGQSHHMVQLKTAVEGRAGQTMLADDFQPDYQILDWIQKQDQIALDAVNTQLRAPQITSVPKCDQPSYRYSSDHWDIPSINRVDELEFVTWNCEMFPADREKTIPALAEAISDLDADVVALQEIRFRGFFSGLMDQLPQYDYMISLQSSFMDQAVLFKKDMFLPVRQIEPFCEGDYNFAGRPPLRVDLRYVCDGDTLPISVVNLHMKCCDSGLQRRQGAARQLHEYLADSYAAGNRNIVVLGDWNDDIKDAPNAHCFHPFLEDPIFHFPTEIITYDIDQASYPKEPYVSFLDHIAVTRDLLDPSAEYRVQTLPMGTYFGSFKEYERLISDHLPVMVGIPLK